MIFQVAWSEYVAHRYNGCSGAKTAAKTVISECGAPLQILLHLVTFRYTYDRGMWPYEITVIAHEALFCKSC
jgi:hypothetical protein